MKQKQYAKVIREKRKALGWTQKELAEKIFSTQQAVARWENSVTEPNLDSLTALSRNRNPCKPFSRQCCRRL